MLNRINSIPLHKSYFDLFSLPHRYEIDKGLLKRRYFQASKTSASPRELNEAYSILQDDFLRAKLFTVPCEVDKDFLEECLVMEERIRGGEDLSGELRRRIEECKERYKEPEYVTRWGYYKRLLD